MSHSITAKLNKTARQHPNASGVTFFVDLGERNYNFQTKQNEYTNYSAALFAKDGQIAFYSEALVEGAIVEVSGTGLILEMPSDPQYKPKLMIQDAKLGFVNSPSQAQQAPQQGYQQPRQQSPQQAPSPQYNQAPPQQRAPQPTPQHRPQQSPAQQRAPQYPDASQDFNDDLPPF